MFPEPIVMYKNIFSPKKISLLSQKTKKTRKDSSSEGQTSDFCFSIFAQMYLNNSLISKIVKIVM